MSGPVRRYNPVQKTGDGISYVYMREDVDGCYIDAAHYDELRDMYETVVRERDEALEAFRLAVENDIKHQKENEQLRAQLAKIYDEALGAGIAINTGAPMGNVKSCITAIMELSTPRAGA